MAKPKSLKDRFPNTDPEVLKILKDLLHVNPYLRLSAKDLVKSKIFDSVKVFEVETLTSPKKYHLACDNYDMYNYTEKKDLYFDNMGEIRASIIKEVVKLKKWRKTTLAETNKQ